MENTETLVKPGLETRFPLPVGFDGDSAAVRFTFSKNESGKAKSRISSRMT